MDIDPRLQNRAALAAARDINNTQGNYPTNNPRDGPLRAAPPHRQNQQPLGYDRPVAGQGYPAQTTSGHHGRFSSPENSTSTPSSTDYSGYPGGGSAPAAEYHHANTHDGRPPRRDDPNAAEMHEGRGDEHDPSDPLADLKRPRACEACRQLKVRCEPDPSHPEGSCRRCAKANRTCIVTQPSRKRQKKTDSRVAELEKKIDALTASLQSSQQQKMVDADPSGTAGEYGQIPPARRWLVGGTAGTSVSGASPLINTPSASSNSASNPSPTMAGSKRLYTGEGKFGGYGILAPMAAQEAKAAQESGPASEKTAGLLPMQNPLVVWHHSEKWRNQKDAQYVDVIDRGLVEEETAVKCFERFVNDFSPNMPILLFPPGTTAGEIRRKRPILFLVIVSITIGAFQPDIQMQLNDEAHCIFAEKVIIKGEKSLELVQAISLSCMWYAPPEHFEELKFFQFIHVAVVMALDIGIGRRTKKQAPKPIGMWREMLGKKGAGLDPDSLETRRTWLGCYFMAVNACMALRRPLLVRWGPYMDECVEIMESSPDALPSDRYLVYWAKLSHIAEDVGTQFAMDDAVCTTSLVDPQIQFAMKGFEKRLDEWRKQIRPDENPVILQHAGHVINIYMHEIAMHADHNVDDFKPPFWGGLRDEQKMDQVTAAHINALTACLTSIHKALSIMATLDHNLINTLPTIYFARTSYSFVALLKLYSAVTHPGSSLSQVFAPSDLGVEEHLNKMIAHLKVSARYPGGRTPGKFCKILNLLRSWFFKRKEPPTEDLTQIAKMTEKPSVSGDKEAVPGGQDAGGSGLHLLSEVATGDPSRAGPRSTSESSMPAAASQFRSPMQVSDGRSEHSNSGSVPPTADGQWSQYPVAQVTGAAMNPPFYQPSSQVNYVPTSAQYDNSMMSGEMSQGQPAFAGFVPELGMQIPFDHESIISLGGMLDESFFTFPMDSNQNFYPGQQ